MNPIYILFVSLSFVVNLCSNPVGAQTMMSTNYSIKWDVADGGGGTLMSSNYTLTDSVAQPTAIGDSMSSGYTLQAGFMSVPDDDGDGLRSFVDNCSEVANPSQYDSNNDGYGNICDPDLDNNGIVNFLDYLEITATFTATPGDANWNPDADLNGDNIVNFLDISLFSPFFLNTPGPSGLAP